MFTSNWIARTISQVLLIANTCHWMNHFSVLHITFKLNFGCVSVSHVVNLDNLRGILWTARNLGKCQCSCWQLSTCNCQQSFVYSSHLPPPTPQKFFFKKFRKYYVEHSLNLVMYILVTVTCHHILGICCKYNRVYAVLRKECQLLSYVRSCNSLIL